MNLALIDAAVDATEEVVIPSSLDNVCAADEIQLIPDNADEFAKKIIEPSMRQKGDDIPVSAMSVDGVIPTGTACLEKEALHPEFRNGILKIVFNAAFAHLLARMQQSEQNLQHLKA